MKKNDSDFVRSLLTSKVFDGEGKYIFIARRYAADELPEETEDLKLISSEEGKYLGINNIGQSGPETPEYHDFYVRKYHYVPLRVKHLAKLNEKKKELGLLGWDKLKEKRSSLKYPSISQMEFEEYKIESKKVDEAIDEIYKEMEPFEKEFNKFWDTFRGKYLVKDEIRIPITADNLELHIKPTKKNLQKLSREDIAQWYLLETSANYLADTPKKLETALRKRRTDILKNLPSDKQIKDLIGDDALKKGKEDLDARIKKKEARDKMYAFDEDDNIFSFSEVMAELLEVAKENFSTIIIFGIIGVGLATCINNSSFFETPDTCTQAFKIHKDVDVYQTCQDNKRRQEFLEDLRKG